MADSDLQQFWQDVFCLPGSHAWPGLVDESCLRHLVEDPGAQETWNLATVELVLRSLTRAPA